MKIKWELRPYGIDIQSIPMKYIYPFVELTARDSVTGVICSVDLDKITWHHVWYWKRQIKRTIKSHRRLVKEELKRNKSIA